MIDRSHIGRVFPSHTVQVEPGRIRSFCRVIGETDSIYFDEGTARAAGYRGLPAPPTFLFALDLDRPEPLAWVKEIGIDLGRLLHGEQQFRYYVMVCAGDQLTFTSSISDVYAKKGGALDFAIRDTSVANQEGVHVADLRTVAIQRNS